MVVGLGTVKKSSLTSRIACRFTFDNWATQSEVAAKPTSSAYRDDAQDAFKFCIPLSEYCRLGTNVMEFCIRCQVNNEDFWDNNMNNNYVVYLSVDRQKNYRGNKMAMKKSGTTSLEYTHDEDKAEQCDGDDRDSTHTELVKVEADPDGCDVPRSLSLQYSQEEYTRKKSQLAPLIRNWPSVGCGSLVGGEVEPAHSLGTARVM
jgi:hypothetical protein